jgi:RNA polymerase sigma-70 factor (ECF subfamily)
LREAFVLKYVEGLEYAEMVTITGAGMSALKMRVKRACDALRPMLEAIYHD